MPKHTKHVTTVVSKRVFCVCLLVYCYLVLAVVMDLRPISDEEDVQTTLDMLESHKRRVNSHYMGVVTKTAPLASKEIRLLARPH